MSNKAPFFSFILIVLVCAGLGVLFWSHNAGNDITPPASTPARELSPSITPEPKPSSQPDINKTVQVTPALTPALTPTPTPLPTASPIPLKDSDGPLKQTLLRLQQGKKLIDIMTDEEIVRKIVRAVYGVSEGRIVREFRPINSPTTPFTASKIGRQTADKKQELYRIAAENDARYADYIAIFSMLNNDASMGAYRFLRPTFEEAYQELGIVSGNFHSTLLNGIQVLLDAPDSDQAMLLIQPSVRFTFQNPALEKLSPAHKLMLRMGIANSEALKLELNALKRRLEAF